MKSLWKLIIGWRLLLLLVSLIATLVLRYRPDFLYSSLGFEHFIWSWANFDGVLYLENAAGSLLAEPRFLPLFPLLIKLFSLRWLVATPLSVQAGVGLVITHVAFGLSLIWLYQLLKLDYPELVAKRALWFLVLFPTSFFLVALYGESIFLALVLGAFLSARHKQWWLSFACVGLASVTRLPGILLLIPIAWEWWVSNRTSQKPQFNFEKLLPLAVAVLPLILLVVANFQTFGDPLKFVHAQGELANGRSTSALVFPLIVFWRYLNILTSLSPQIFEWWIALLELGSGLLAVAVVYFSWKLKLRASYQLYSLAMMALPFLSGTLSGFPRYVVIVFPLFLLLAHVPKNWGRLVLISCAILQMLLVALFTRGYFVA